MIALLDEKRKELESLCRRFDVSRLEVFGSATHGSFDEARSDVDFLVQFQPLEPGPLADAYFGLLTALRQLLQRDVDLVTPKAIKNPYFARSIDQTRRLLYAA